MTKSKLQQMTSRWMEEGKYGRVIDELEKTPIAKRGAKLTVLLAQARIRRYGVGDQEDPKAPAGWKEKTIRELEYFGKDPTPEWQEAMARLKGLPYEPPAPPKETTPPPAVPTRTPKPSSGGKKNSSAAGSAGNTPPPQGERSLEEIKVTAASLLMQGKSREFLKLLESVELWKVDLELARLLMEGIPALRKYPNIGEQFSRTVTHLLRAPDPQVYYYLSLTADYSPEEALKMALSDDAADMRLTMNYHLAAQFWKLQRPAILRRHGLRPLPGSLKDLFAERSYETLLERWKDSLPEEGNWILLYVSTVLEQHILNLNLDDDGEPNTLEMTSALLDGLPSLLRSMESEGRNIPLWHLAWAGIYTFEEEIDLSCQSWRRASELDPEDKDLRAVVLKLEDADGCGDDLAVFHEGWRVGVDRIWNSFREKEREIYRALRSEEEEEEDRGYELLDDVLGDLDYEAFWAYPEDRKIHIVFGSGDQPERIFELADFCSRMPEELKKRWAFHPYMKQWTEDMGTPADWKVSWVRDPKTGKPAVNLSPDPDLDVSKLSEDELREGAEDDLRWAIGELNMRHIASVRVQSIPSGNQSAFPLTRLRREMEKMGIRMADDFRSWERSAPVLYRLSGGKEARQGNLRGDILYGANLFDGFAFAPHNWDQEAYRRWTSYHITPGFFYIPVGELITEQRHLALSMLEHFLTEHTDPSLFQTLGWAVGKEYVYVDVLVWDLPALLQAAKSCAKYHLMEGLLFHRFNVNSDPIVVKDWTPPKE